MAGAFCELVYPVLQAQTWNLAQMLEVARYQCSPARQGDAGYEQIGSSYLAQTALRPQLVKAPGRGLVKRDDKEVCLCPGYTWLIVVRLNHRPAAPGIDVL